MNYVLDTNAVSAFMRGDARMAAMLSTVPRDRVRVPQPVFAEIEYGIERHPVSRKRESLRRQLQVAASVFLRVEWLDEVNARFGAIKAALEKRGSRLEDFDLAIAAHALATGAVLVSSDVRQMSRVPGLTVEDWTAPR